MKKLIYLSILAVICIRSQAQSDIILYNFDAIPQSLHVNPAMPQQTKLWIGLPVISGIKVGFHNSGFKLVDVFGADVEGNEGLKSVAANMDDKSHIAHQEDLELLGVGFKTGKGFFSMGAIQKIDYKMDYPADLLKFLTYDADDENSGNGFNMNEFDYEAMVSTQVYLGYQHKIKDKLTVGGRFKYIIGQHHSWAEKTIAEVNTSDPWALKIKTDFHIRTAGVAGILDSSSNFGSDVMRIALPENRGMAIDLGAHFKFNEKWSASFSLIDFGQIKWTADTRDYVSKGEYTFEGFDRDMANTDDEGDYWENAFRNTVDSLEVALNFQEIDGDSYKHSLTERLFVGVNYNFTKKHGVGLLYHAKFWEGEMYNDYSISYQGRWARGIQFHASYAIVDGIPHNIGAGIDLKLGPLQLYLMSYNILGAVMYENLQSTNLRLGLNLTFYGKKGDSAGDILEDPLAEPLNPAAPAPTDSEKP